jgi:hypothetical protein
MAIALKNIEGTNLLEVVVSGKLAHEDYERFLPRVDQLVARHGKIRVLFDMVDFHGWEASALWDETKFTFKHFNDISRIAMVGDALWEKGMSAFCRPFTAAEIRYFDWTQIHEAWAWLGVSHEGRVRQAAMADG